MAKAKVIELSDQELIDVVDRYEYLSTLLENKTIPAIQRLEKLENEKTNINTLVNELTTTKDFLGKLSTNLSDETKQKIETYLNNKVVVILKETFENNETLKSNISKIAQNSIYFQKVLENDEKNLKAYKKMLGFKGLVFSSLIGILIGFFIGMAFFRFQEPPKRIENFLDLHSAILENKVSFQTQKNEKIQLIYNNTLLNEGSFIDDIKVSKITSSQVTFYSFRDNEYKTWNFSVNK
ncbi:hypothetical protein [Aliarcobacter butzleri]|uniref:hypothetical protein n=1 Tax=Aliarcobacter butzleri TaxID=28197 RepID=UPI0021B37F2D|nr:hypothetical protein [Aliarcobacter butzleri]MCT7614045.1 hypothetical protein [Aliarcobacter butzleri]